MSKALVEVTIPAAEKKFDIFIPLDSRLYEVCILVSAALTELSEGKFIGSGDCVLCDGESGEVLDVSMIVSELGIKNGSKLMLI